MHHSSLVLPSKHRPKHVPIGHWGDHNTSITHTHVINNGVEAFLGVVRYSVYDTNIYVGKRNSEFCPCIRDGKVRNHVETGIHLG